MRPKSSFIRRLVLTPLLVAGVLTTSAAAWASPEARELTEFENQGLEMLRADPLFSNASDRDIVRVLQDLNDLWQRLNNPSRSLESGDSSSPDGGPGNGDRLLEEGIRPLSPVEIEQLKGVGTENLDALRELMANMSIPENSVVLITSAGGVACPVEANSVHFSLLFISFGSAHQSNEPSETCREFMQIILDDATLDRIGGYLDLLGRTDRHEILMSMIQYLAATRFGITPRHLDVIMLDLRPDSELSPQELQNRRLRMQELLEYRRQQQQLNQQTEQSN